MPNPLDAILDTRPRRPRSVVNDLLGSPAPQAMTDEERRSRILADSLFGPPARSAPPTDDFGPPRAAPRMVDVAAEVQRRNPLPAEDRPLGAESPTPMSPAARRTLLGYDAGSEQPAAPPPPPRGIDDATRREMVLNAPPRRQTPVSSSAPPATRESLMALLGGAGETARSVPAPAAQAQRGDDWPDYAAGMPVLRRGGTIVDTAPDGLDPMTADRWRAISQRTAPEAGRVRGPDVLGGEVPYAIIGNARTGDTWAQVNPAAMMNHRSNLAALGYEQGVAGQQSALDAARMNAATADKDRQAALDRMMAGLDASEKQGEAARAAEMEREKLKFSPEAIRAQALAAMMADAINNNRSPGELRMRQEAIDRILGPAGGTATATPGVPPLPGVAVAVESPVPDPVSLLIGEARGLLRDESGNPVPLSRKKAESLLDRVSDVSLTPDQRQEFLRRLFLGGHNARGEDVTPLVSDPGALFEAITKAVTKAASNAQDIGRGGEFPAEPYAVAGMSLPFALERRADPTILSGMNDAWRYLSSGFDGATPYRQAVVGGRVVPLDAEDLSKNYFAATDADRQAWRNRLTGGNWLLQSLARIAGQGAGPQPR